MTTLQLEAQNKGKPTNKKIITNRKNLSEDVPQAWYDKEYDVWHYNQAGAILECWDLLPTKENWKQIKKELGVEGINKLLPKCGYRTYSVGSLYDQGTYGYYWSSSPSTTNGCYLCFDSASVYPAYNNDRSYGFSVRCLKNLGEETTLLTGQSEPKESDSSTGIRNENRYGNIIDILTPMAIESENKTNSLFEVIRLLKDLN